MQIINNEGRIARGARIGKVGTLVGLGFLVAGLIISLVMKESPLLWLSFVCLLLGFLGASIGTLNMNRWVREPRPDQALAQGLKGFDERYRLYNYSLPAPHVLLSPLGLYVLTALGQDGVIRYEGGRFRRGFSAARLLRFMADEGLGRPFAEADSQVQAMQGFLAANNVNEGIEIENVVVFTNPRAELVGTEFPRPVVDAKGVKKAVRKQKERKLSATQYRQLQELFDQVSS